MQKPRIIKQNTWISRFVEQTPVIYKGKMLMVVFTEDVPPLQPILTHVNPHVAVADLESRETLATLAEGFSYPSAYVEGDTLFVFAANTNGAGFHGDVHVFRTDDLINWQSSMAVAHAPGEKNINSSVCKGPDGYVMAYETNSDVPFTIKFARSNDLIHWEKLPDTSWRKDKYTACPAIRYYDGHYYMFYLNEVLDPRFYETMIARSRDLVDWEDSPANPVLSPTPEEGINNSDIDMVEHSGKVHIFYHTGDQLGSGKTKLAIFDGSLGELLTGFFDGQYEIARSLSESVLASSAK